VEDLKSLMETNFLTYASYVILDRAIPHAIDGLKPVQRRILHTLFKMNDGKMHKVANVAGQTMMYHPHGDAAIVDALVHLANRGYLLDMQGNFGNLLTGDPSAAARYIEARLSPLALDTLFNSDLIEYIPSYDGRNSEPTVLPVKIPLVLLQGASGIAVGMATNILPHNFNEVLEASIAFLEGRPFTLLPDFPTGGIMDASEYAQGKGKVKVRANIEVKDQKTLVIRSIAFGSTTESLIRSIDEAAKSGKIKIDGIHDYTASAVEIEIKLARGYYAEETIDQLYAYTECEVSLNSQIIVIRDDLPWEPTVDELIAFHAEKLEQYHLRELNLERERLFEKIFMKNLERLFIEERIYKKIEELVSYEKIHEVLEKAFKSYTSQLLREPTYDDREHLLSIPIRRISRFDLEKNKEEVEALKESLQEIEKQLKHVRRYTINFLKKLLAKYGKRWPRKTDMRKVESVDRRAIETKEVVVGFDIKTGFVGTKVSTGVTFTCTNFDKLQIFYDDGSFKVIPMCEKEYVGEGTKKPLYVFPADKKSVISTVYRDPKTYLCYGKRFTVKQFILGKKYRYTDEEMEIVFVTAEQEPKVELHFLPHVKQKVKKMLIALNDLLEKGVQSRGVRLAKKPVKKVLLLTS